MFHGSLPPLGRGADLRLDVALPASGEGLRAELGELFGVGAAGRVPLHDAPSPVRLRSWRRDESFFALLDVGLASGPTT